MAARSTIGIFGLLVIILGLAAGIIYYTSLVKPPVPQPPRSYSDLLEFQNMSFDFSVMDRESFENLQVFGAIPVLPGVTGREDLFAPLF